VASPGRRASVGGPGAAPNRPIVIDLRNNHFQFAPRMKKAHEGLGKNSKKFQE
jgi:hypothetical protein